MGIMYLFRHISLTWSLDCFVGFLSIIGIENVMQNPPNSKYGMVLNMSSGRGSSSICHKKTLGQKQIRKQLYFIGSSNQPSHSSPWTPKTALLTCGLYTRNTPQHTTACYPLIEENSLFIIRQNQTPTHNTKTHTHTRWEVVKCKATVEINDCRSLTPSPPTLTLYRLLFWCKWKASCSYPSSFLPFPHTNQKRSARESIYKTILFSISIQFPQAHTHIK